MSTKRKPKSKTHKHLQRREKNGRFAKPPATTSEMVGYETQPCAAPGTEVPRDRVRVIIDSEGSVWGRGGSGGLPATTPGTEALREAASSIIGGTLPTSGCTSTTRPSADGQKDWGDMRVEDFPPARWYRRFWNRLRRAIA